MEKTIFSQEYRVFIDLLIEARQKAGLTQEEVAHQLGTTQSVISKCERRERRMDIVEVRAYCRALGISFTGFASKFDNKVRKG